MWVVSHFRGDGFLTPYHNSLTPTFFNMEYIIGIILIIASFLFAYVSSVVLEEEKKNKKIPLFWEKEFWKKRKIFDKSDIEYRDGDNT